MLAHCVVHAEVLRAEPAAGEVLLAKPNTWEAHEQPSQQWKAAYFDLVCSTPSLKLEERGLLLLLLKLSDRRGRVWRGQIGLAEQAGCSDRNLRRLLPNLKQAGHLGIDRQSFKSLTAEQRALGLRLPKRSDEGRAPNLLTLLVDGRPAYEMQRASRGEARRTTLRVVHDEPGQDEPRPSVVRTVPQDKNDQGGPRTKVVDTPPDKMADDLSGSTMDTRKVEGDLTRATPPTLKVDEPVQTIVGAPSNSTGPTETRNATADVDVAPRPSNSAASTEAPNAATDIDAWRTLNAAYDAHYRRVYRSTPMGKVVQSEDKSSLTRHLTEMAALFETQLRERNVDVEKLEAKPLEMLTNEALRTWFDKPGANNYLRNVSHCMRALHPDLPFSVREAMKVLLARHAPKPEPRKGLAPVVSLVSATMGRAERDVSQDKPGPRSSYAEAARTLARGLFAPMGRDQVPRFRLPGVKVRLSEPPPISPETERFLKGLSMRSALREFGTHVPFANELLALGRDHGLGVEQVLGALDELNRRVSRLDSLSKQAKTNAVYVAATDVFAGLNERFGRVEHDETNESKDVAAGPTGAGLVENNAFADAAGLGFATAKRACADGR